MAATPGAAHKAVIKVGTATVPTALLLGMNATTLTEDRTVIDVTDFTLDDKRKFLGLKSGTMTMSGFKDKTDAGQVILDLAIVSGVDIFVRLLLDGLTNGFEVVVKVASRDINVGIDDVVTITYNLEITTSAAGNSVTVLP